MDGLGDKIESMFQKYKKKKRKDQSSGSISGYNKIWRK